MTPAAPAPRSSSTSTRSGTTCALLRELDRRRDDDGGQGRRLRPRHGRGRPRRPRGRAPSGSASRPSTRRSRCAPPATPGRLLCLADRARARTTPRRSPPTSTSRPTPWPSSTRSPPPPRSPAAPRASSSRSTPGCRAAARPLPTGRASSPRPAPASRPAAGGSPASGRTSPAATSPTTRPTTPRRRAFRAALDVADAAGLRPEVRHLANSAAAILRPASRFDLVRVRARDVRPRPGARAHPRPRAAARDDGPRAGSPWSSSVAAGRAVSYGHTWTADARHHGRPGPGRVRRRACPRARQQRAPRCWSTASGARSAAGSAWTSSSSTSAATCRRRRRGRALRSRAPRASPPRRTGPRRAARSPTRS